MKKNKKLNEDTLLNTEFKNEYYTPEDEFPVIHITSLDQYKELTINKVKCCKIFYSDKIRRECYDWFCDYILDKHKKNKKINENSAEAEFDALVREDPESFINNDFEFSDEEAQWIYDTYIKKSDEAPTILIESLEQYKYIIINHPSTYNMSFISSELRQECDDWDFDYYILKKN